MTHFCKKCKSTVIVGPTWVEKTDRLRYDCRTCGYFWTTPTAEDKERDFAREMGKRGGRGEHEDGMGPIPMSKGKGGRYDSR